ncbi:MAG TPA: copper chaperone PCu(A)C [Burkholderiales bacterium]|nr:copper chaperone PCu(A)C [Burkholderiales bacterium]
MFPSKLSVASLLCIVVPAAWAQATVSGAWARATVPGQTSAGVYMSLASPSDTVLKSVETPAGKAQLHEMRMDGNVMRMRALPQLPVHAGKAVELSPQGNHLMIDGLKKPLAKGDKLPLKLHFVGRDGKAQDVTVQAEVLGLDATGPKDGTAGMGTMPMKH